MKRIKVTLGDGEKYVFSTLPMSQATAFKKKIENDKSSDRIDELDKKNNKVELTIEEAKEMEELQEGQIGIYIAVVRLSLARDQPQFANQGDVAQDKEIDDKVMELMDFREMASFMTFALAGTMTKDEPIEFDNNEIQDLTVTPPPIDITNEDG
tara:strand:- start:58 stop:519 length:462 start_codon:yes stop_codon:yes gene_type:complete